MILEQGENLLIVHRRLFERDHSRFFVGRVEAYEDGIARVTGYSFARDPDDLVYCRKNECHSKLVSLTSGTLLFYLLPIAIDVAQIQLQSLAPGLCLTDGESFSMNISEWIHKHSD